MFARVPSFASQGSTEDREGFLWTQKERRTEVYQQYEFLRARPAVVSTVVQAVAAGGAVGSAVATAGGAVGSAAAAPRSGSGDRSHAGLSTLRLFWLPEGTRSSRRRLLRCKTNPTINAAAMVRPSASPTAVPVLLAPPSEALLAPSTLERVAGRPVVPAALCVRLAVDLAVDAGGSIDGVPGSELVGVSVGLGVGLGVGANVAPTTVGVVVTGLGVGLGLGDGVGSELVGVSVGLGVGLGVGDGVGDWVGSELVGLTVGESVRLVDGRVLGANVHSPVCPVLLHSSSLLKLQPVPRAQSSLSSWSVQSRPPTLAQNAVAS